MKNIHVIPTDKPSRYWMSKVTNNLNFGNPDLESGICKFKNINITSDEEIKVGDYRYSLLQNNFELVSEFSLKVNKEYWKLNNQIHKKIILTTDQDLIKNGVQAIDDEFLEWFVKNPSCDEVEIDYGFFTPSGKKVDPMGILQNHSKCVWIYKIIIPQEEPKQETLEQKQETLEQKQETLEQMINILPKKYAKNLDLFLKGMQYQKDQDKNKYSEEEVLELIQFLAEREDFKENSSMSIFIAQDFLQKFKNK